MILQSKGFSKVFSKFIGPFFLGLTFRSGHALDAPHCGPARFLPVPRGHWALPSAPPLLTLFSSASLEPALGPAPTLVLAPPSAPDPALHLSSAPRSRRPFQARWPPANSFHHVRRFELQRTAPGSSAPPVPARAGERRRFHSCVSSWARAPSLNSAGPEGGRPWRRRRPLEVRAGQGLDGRRSSGCLVDRHLPVHFPGAGHRILRRFAVGMLGISPGLVDVLVSRECGEEEASPCWGRLPSPDTLCVSSDQHNPLTPLGPGRGS